MTSQEHIAKAIHHSDRVTSVGERDIIPGVIHALCAVAVAITENKVVEIVIAPEEGHDDED